MKRSTPAIPILLLPLVLPQLLACTDNPEHVNPEAMMATLHSPATLEQAESSTPLRMQVQVIGDGPPLVLIGGGLTGWRSWEPHAERLADSRRVARLQLLNVQFGLESRPLPPNYGVRLESAALHSALDEIGWTEPLDLVAWSYGALVTLDFALDNPTRVRTLTLIEPPAIWVLGERDTGDPELEKLLAFARSIGTDIDEDELENFVRLVALSPPGIAPQELPQWPTWVEHRRSLLNTTAPFDHHDDTARLRAFDRPVLLVTGTGTSSFLRRIHDTLAAYLPRARTAEMPAGHAPQLVSMDRFLAEVERFQAER